MKILLTDFGADRTGRADISDAFARAVSEAAKGAELFIPAGRYKVSRTLLVPSNVTVTADPCARIFLDGEPKKHRGDYLLTNADHEHGNQNITIRGGVWDGNSAGKENKKPEDIFDPNGFSGTVLNFRNVRGLHLSELVVANAVGYHVRMASLSDFTIENISFLADHPGFTQDGLHFNGDVHRGTVRNIRALSYGLTTDDLIALNADDSMERIENFGMLRGEISDITFENLFAENAHTLIRLLSVDAPIRNITIRGVFGGFRCNAINADGARYCRTPLFDEKDFPDGCGRIENVVIENMICYPTEKNCREAICLESLADGLRLSDFHLLCDEFSVPALRARHLSDTVLLADGKKLLIEKADAEHILENFGELTVTHPVA